MGGHAAAVNAVGVANGGVVQRRCYRIFFLYSVRFLYLDGMPASNIFLKARDFILFKSKSLTQVFSNNSVQVLLVRNGRIWKEDKNVNNVLLAATFMDNSER